MELVLHLEDRQLLVLAQTVAGVEGQLPAVDVHVQDQGRSQGDAGVSGEVPALRGREGQGQGQAHAETVLLGVQEDELRVERDVTHGERGYVRRSHRAGGVAAVVQEQRDVQAQREVLPQGDGAHEVCCELARDDAVLTAGHVVYQGVGAEVEHHARAPLQVIRRVVGADRPHVVDVGRGPEGLHVEVHLRLRRRGRKEQGGKQQAGQGGTNRHRCSPIQMKMGAHSALRRNMPIFFSLASPSSRV